MKKKTNGNRKSIISLLAALTLMLCVVTGCGGSGKETGQSGQESTQAGQAASATGRPEETVSAAEAGTQEDSTTEDDVPQEEAGETKVLPVSVTMLEEYGNADTGEVQRATETKNTYEYDANGLLVTETSTVSDSAPSVVHYSYDAAGNLVGRKKDGLETPLFSCEYDAEGRPYRQTEFIYPSTYTTGFVYDGEGRCIQELIQDEKYGARRRIDRVYDDAGNLLSETDTSIMQDDSEMVNQTTEYEYDAEGRVLRMKANGVVTDYTYDANGNLVRRAAGEANVTEYAYDDAGRLVRETSVSADMIGTVNQEILYNEQGDIVSHITETNDPGGHMISTVTYEYEYTEVRQ